MFQVSYLCIRVQGADGQQKIIAVKSYKSGDVSKKSLALAAYNDLLRYLQKTGYYKEATHELSEGILPGSALRGAFNGKASTQTCSLVLRLVDHYLVNAEIPFKKFGWAHANVTLQDYADWYLGLDCNGFVGNYFQYAYPVSTIGPSTSCNDFDSYGHHGVKRKALDEIRPLDVLVREGSGGTRHVAIIESIQKTGDKTASIRLAQSAFSRNGLSSAYENITWLAEPTSKAVLSLKVNGYMDFNYAIGFPWTA